MVRVAVYLPGMTASWSLVDFLLDTGAATTCLHPPDTVERLAISNQRLQSRDAWESVETYHGVGGGATYFVTRDDAVLRCADRIEAIVGLRVKRPSDLLLWLHSDANRRQYRPEALLETSLSVRPLTGASGSWSCQ